MDIVCASPTAHQFCSVLSPKEIVRERLRGRIRTLRGEIAIVREEKNVQCNPRLSTLMIAITSNRRRIRPRSRPRTISCGYGRSYIGEHTDLHRRNPCPFFIKVLARLGEIFDFS